MSGDTPQSDWLAADDHIDDRCDAFESAWRVGQRPNISDYIYAEDETYRARLFCELLLVDVECRRAAGEQPTEDLYLREFPEFTEQIQATSFRYGTSVFPATNNGVNTAQDSPRRVGSYIAHFKLVERLGAGAMGEAWKAWDGRLKRHVTIKLPNRTTLTQNDFRRFLREGEVAAQLRHPQLASVYEINKDDNTFYLVAAFVDGKNLKEYAAEHQLDFDAIAELCASIGDALQVAHDRGVIHRDLKPANIVVDSSGAPHLIDFGLAKIRDAEQDLTMAGELLGTPAYMAPELVSGKSDQADAQTDVYSLGIILFELLARRCPFEGARSSIVDKIIACEPPKPRSLVSSIPRDLETICLKAIVKSRNDRYGTAADLADDLRRFLARKPIKARRSGIFKRGWRWAQRQPATAASLALMLIVIASTGLVVNGLYIRNKRLAGIRPVSITTSPAGARLALVPVDPFNSEPSPDRAAIIRPSGLTPLTVDLPPGTYLVEAVLPSTDPPEFVEVYRTVADQNEVSSAIVQRNEKLGLDRSLCQLLCITFRPQQKTIEQMVEVTIPKSLRTGNPWLQEKLYVDAEQTTAAGLTQSDSFRGFVTKNQDGEPCISFTSATRWAESNQTRLPSAAEYDAIVAAVKLGNAHFVGTGKNAKLADIFDGFPEWSTTTESGKGVNGSGTGHRLHGMHVLKGFANIVDPGVGYAWINGALLKGTTELSPRICIRGVRSATPRITKL